VQSERQFRLFLGHGRVSVRVCGGYGLTRSINYLASSSVMVKVNLCEVAKEENQHKGLRGKE
jgi:hypothetical protein